VYLAVPDFAWFDEQRVERHSLGAGRPLGEYLRPVGRVRAKLATLLVWPRPVTR
jgi:hypothetical protein